MEYKRLEKQRLYEKLFILNRLSEFDNCWNQLEASGKWVLEHCGGWVFGKLRFN